MSLMSLGLAETVREWFANGAGGVATAVETATEAAVDVAAPPKSKTARGTKKRTTAEGAGSDDDSGVDTIEAPPEPEVAPPPPEAPAPAPVIEAAPPAPIIEEAPPKPQITIQ